MSDKLVRGQATVNADDFEKKQNEAFYLSLALEDALAELAHERGMEYLDVFLERRIRRTSEIDQMIISQLPDNVEGLLEHREAVMQAGIEALRRAVEGARRDPSRVV